MILGIDISRHQGTVDFQTLASQSGMRFCYCKASEGGDYEDPNVATYWRGLLGTDIYRGLYHFARPDLRTGRSGGETEGRNFVRVAKSLGHTGQGMLPPMLDFEKYSESDANENIPWIDGWLHVVENELARPAGVYTGANIWKYEVGNTDKYNTRNLWQVDYTATRTKPKEIADGNWPWTFWQYSGGGDFAYYGPVPGVNGVVDVNRFYGDETDLRVLALSPSDKPVPPPSKGQNVMPWIDLGASSGSCSQSVAMVQGLLLAAGYGPEGLVGSNGRPDGIAGSKTLAALQNFQRDHGLVEGAVVDGSVWWTLLASK